MVFNMLPSQSASFLSTLTLLDLEGMTLSKTRQAGVAFSDHNGQSSPNPRTGNLEAKDRWGRLGQGHS